VELAEGKTLRTLVVLPEEKPRKARKKGSGTHPNSLANLNVGSPAGGFAGAGRHGALMP